MSAQTPGREPGQILVSLETGKNPNSLIRRFTENFEARQVKAERIADLMNIWLLKISDGDDMESLKWLRAQPEVQVAQFNFLFNERSNPPNNLLPDDPLFSQQWQYVNNGANGGTINADLDADLAWDIATGGVTPAGDTIVVAVIDGGIDLNHNDLKQNLWKNWDEIPGDNIDNDNNGYVDDFRGWNVFSNNDNIAGVSTGHGTPVSAIVGAKGNNQVGVTGVNWNVKIMFIAGSGSQAHILASYDYVLKARQRYNNSNGQAGAFIVAVNCSWGTDYGQPGDAPLWCAAFDSLGQAGILSIAATANNPVNVDDFGDLPTTCPSDFLVSVTSLTNADVKSPNAAWGATHVDLGTYGQHIFTAGANNSYGTQTGTSFATPHVSGAIALLYSSPCPNLIALAKTDPAAAAIWAKNLLLNSTVPNASLQSITLTGGRLNLHTLLQDYEEQCSPCPPPFGLAALDISTGSILLKWSEIADYQIVNLRWRVVNTPDWNLLADVQSNYLLENLTPCTSYEFSLAATCEGGLTSDWSAPVTFKTDGCCEPPSSIWTLALSPSSAEISWSKITAATDYRLRIRSQGGNWNTFDVNGENFVLQGLWPCTDYEVQVQTLCAGNETLFSGSLFFKTTGCGSCTDANYCAAVSESADDEWIASVVVGGWEHNSGNGGNGYQNFTSSVSETPVFFPQEPVNVTITPGFQGLSYKEFFRIYVDFNMDGDFDDAGELAFDPGWATENPISGVIVPPDFTVTGQTRMRVMMKYKGPGETAPYACESFEFGQVEDYCAELSSGAVPTGETPNSNFTIRAYPQPADNEVWLELPDTKGDSWNLSVLDLAGKRIVSGILATQNGLARVNTSGWFAGIYFVEMRCGEKVFQGKIIKI